MATPNFYIIYNTYNPEANADIYTVQQKSSWRTINGSKYWLILHITHFLIAKFV